MIQQEHERQVGLCSDGQGTQVEWGAGPHSQLFVLQEREDELRAMARKIRMK